MFALCSCALRAHPTAELLWRLRLIVPSFIFFIRSQLENGPCACISYLSDSRGQSLPSIEAFDVLFQIW